MKKITVILTSLALGSLFSCKKTPESETAKGLYEVAPYPIGVAIAPADITTDSMAKNLVMTEFNSITSENYMKMRQLRPCDTCYNWKQADEVAAFCKANNKRLHGHTLIWHSEIPDFIAGYTQKDSAKLEQFIQQHIKETVGRYKGTAKSWDVVNEAIADDGSGLRPSFWLTILGPNFIERAYRYAHEADPEAKLFYNEYWMEFQSPKELYLLKMLDTLKAHGVPIDGVGFQMHTGAQYPALDTIKAAVDSVVKRGLLLHFSEIDISFWNKDSVSYNDSLQQILKQRYHDIVKVYNTIPRAQQYGITFWNLTDRTSWIRSYMKRPFEKPLLFDENYQKKPAYDGFKDALTGK